MQIISPMKKTLRKVFAAPHFDAGRQSAAIPIRHMKFGGYSNPAYEI